MYQEFYEICIVFSYTSHKHFVQIWIESQFIYQSYEPLLDCVSACVEYIADYFDIFSEIGAQVFCLCSFYIRFDGIKYCDLFVK